jgi:hypothetical protein
MTMTEPKPAPPAEKYSPTSEEWAVIDKEERKIAPAPRLKVEDNTYSIDHPDERVGQLLLRNALGTSDAAFTSGLLNQLVKATSGGPIARENELNFMVSVIKGIEPRDQLEAMLAGQMAAVHLNTMRLLQQMPAVGSLPQLDALERATNKFARTFLFQMEALKRHRSGGEQKVTVQNVSIGDGGQAIVGNVTQNPRQTATDNAPVAAPRQLAQSKMRTARVLIEDQPREAVLLKRKSSA